jgi:transcriptional regulator with XRE-family HTH domain
MITAEELRQRRLEAGLTQSQVADRLGVAVRSIRNWEATGVPAARTEFVRLELPDSLLEGRLALALAQEHASEAEAMLQGVAHVVEFFRSALDNGASRASVNRGVSAAIATLRETGAIDLLDRETRGALVNVLTSGLHSDDYELAAEDDNPDNEMGENHNDGA